MSAFRILGGSVLGLLLASSSGAQGIGDKAARERAKRTQSKGKEAKVFTNSDLDAGRPPGSKPTEDAASTASAAAPSSDSGAPTQVPEDDRRQQERAYIDAVGAAQAQVATVESRIRDLAGKLNPMSLSYIYGAGGSNDANEEQRVRAEMRQAEEELIAARQGVASANQNLQDFRQGRSVGAQDPR